MTTTLIGSTWVTEHDRREIEAFKRFLAEVGNKPKPGVLRDHPGWWPYVLGDFFWSGARGRYQSSLHPPEGFGDVPITAWTMPG